MTDFDEYMLANEYTFDGHSYRKDGKRYSKTVEGKLRVWNDEWMTAHDYEMPSDLDTFFKERYAKA